MIFFMFVLLFCLMCVVRGSNSSNATEVGEWVRTGAQFEKEWHATAISSSGEICYASGYSNILAVSKDHCQTWSTISIPNLPDSYTYRAIATENTGQYLYLLIDDQNLYNSLFFSSDYGLTFENRTALVPPSQQYAAIACSGNGSVSVIVGYGAGVYISRDMGESYEQPTSGILLSLSSPGVAVSESGAYMAIAALGNGGGIWISSDFGVNWAVIDNLTPTDNFISVAMSSSGSIIYAIENIVHGGGVFKSIDYGSTFEPLLNMTNTTYSYVTCSDTGQYIVVVHSDLSVYSGTSYASVDYGASWNETFNDGTTSELNKNGTLPILGLSSSASGMLVVGAAYDNGVYTYSPGCVAGYIHEGFSDNGDNPCVPCPAGSYTLLLPDSESVYDNNYCTDCEMGFYSTSIGSYGSGNSAVCIKCPFPSSTIGFGDTECTAIYIHVAYYIQLGIFFLLFVYLFNAIMVWNKNHIALLLILAFPLLDNVTNLAYILTARFYNVYIFALVVLVFLHSVPLFLYKLYKHGVYPSILNHIWWLGSHNTASDSSDGSGDRVAYPTCGDGSRFVLLFSFEVHDSLYSLLWELITWCVAILLQLLTLVLLPLFVLVWICFGCVAQMTKTISITTIWNTWFRIYTWSYEFDDRGGGGIDTKMLNYNLLTQLLVETLPTTILQVVNNTLLGLWDSDPIAVLSFVMSIFMLFNVIYKYVYYSFISADPVDMKNIPLDRSIRVKLAYFAVDWGVLEAKLEPYSIIVDRNASNNNAGRNAESTRVYDKLLVVEEDDEEEAVSGGGHGDKPTHSNLPVATNIDAPSRANAVSATIQSAVVVDEEPISRMNTTNNNIYNNNFGFDVRSESNASGTMPILSNDADEVAPDCGAYGSLPEESFLI